MKFKLTGKFANGKPDPRTVSPRLLMNFKIFESEAVCVSAFCREIRPYHVCSRVILVLEGLITDRAAGGHRQAVEIAKAIKHANVFPKLPIESRVVVGLPEWSTGVSGVNVEWRSRNDWRQKILVCVFGVQEEEELVL